MTPCLRPDEFIDLLDGVGEPAARAHVAQCGHCQATLADVQQALQAAQDLDVPEPSPLFWPQVNARVAAAVAAEATPARAWRDWLRLGVLVPLSGLALLVVTLASAVGRAGTPAAAPLAALDPADVIAPAASDDALALVLDLVATLPESEFDSLGVTALPDLGVAAASLSADEQQALRALLTAAVERPQS